FSAAHHITNSNVELLGACVAIGLRIALGECGPCGPHRGTYFLDCAVKIFRTSLDHEFADLRPEPQTLLLQSAFRVVGEEKAFGDRSISLADIDAVAALVAECGCKGHVRHTQAHGLACGDRAR